MICVVRAARLRWWEEIDRIVVSLQLMAESNHSDPVLLSHTDASGPSYPVVRTGPMFVFGPEASQPASQPACSACIDTHTAER